MGLGSMAGALHRSIVAVDVEGSTRRTNPERGELRRILYALLDQALAETGINASHLEPLIDRGDGVLVLIRPHDDVPKTALIGVLVPELAALLDEHNAAIADLALRMRLRAVIHAGEIHDDGRGFYGEDLDLAFRLLDAPKVKRALRDTPEAPMVLVVSEEIFGGIVRHYYVDGGTYEPLIRVRMAGRHHRGWVNFPRLAGPDRPAAARRARDQPLVPSLEVVSTSVPRQSQWDGGVPAATVSGREARRSGRG